jgi:hypothetical protein
MKFFFDNNLPIRVAKGLNEFVAPEHEIVHFKQRFAPGTHDSVWMHQLARETGWAIIATPISGRTSFETEAWKAAGHPVFFLKPSWLKLSFWNQVQRFSKCLPDMIRAAEHAAPGSCFLMRTNGKIEA